MAIGFELTAGDSTLVEPRNRENPYDREGGAVPSTPKVVGDKEAEASGLYEKGSGVKELLDIADPAKTKQLNSDLSDITTDRMETRADTDKRFEYLIGQDRSKMEKAYAAESAGPNSLPPAWNADRERQERIRGPMEQFGSIGSVFAMAASMFTRTPMTSALNAGAAAMEAIKNSDEKGYESAYQAWKDNTNLALKRFEMERQLFTDANTLFTTDQTMWKAKTLANAAQFDDQKTLAFLRAGMDKEVIETQDARIKSAAGLTKSIDDMEQFDVRRSIWKNDPRAKGTVAERIELLEDMKSGKKTVEEQLLRDYRRSYEAEHGAPPSAEDEAKFLSDFRHNSRGTQGSQATKNYEITRRAQEYQKPEAEGGRGLDPVTAYNLAAKEVANASQPDKKDPATINAEIKRRAEEYQKDGTDASKAYDKAAQEVRASNTSVSGNKKVELQQRYDKFTHSTETLDKTLNVLQKYSGAAGLAGKAMRLEERIENIAARGKISQTDRVQMMRDIELLKGWAKGLLFDKSGKPLKAEYDSLANIVAGTGTGDTTANTIRALTDLKKLFGQMQNETKAQLEGNWSPETSKGKQFDVGPEKAKPRWQNDPVVNP